MAGFMVGPDSWAGFMGSVAPRITGELGEALAIGAFDAPFAPSPQRDLTGLR